MTWYDGECTEFSMSLNRMTSVCRVVGLRPTRVLSCRVNFVIIGQIYIRRSHDVLVGLPSRQMNNSGDQENRNKIPPKNLQFPC